MLTARGGTHLSFDPTLLEEVPKATQIYRSSTLLSLIPRTRSSSKVKTSQRAITETPQNDHRVLKRFLAKAYEFFGKWMAIPDAFILWLPFALSQGVSIIRNEKVDIIYSTGPPFSNHLVALILKKITGKPLVADFRDAWMSDPVRKWKDLRGRQTIESFLEKAVITTADLVIATTEGIVQDFSIRYPLEIQEKFVLITNGYDREDFGAYKAHKHSYSGKMRIVHTGYLSMERTPRFFLEALRLLFTERPSLEHKIEVFFIGDNHRFSDGKGIEDYVEKCVLNNVVTLTGHISRIESLKYQMSADILLLIIGIVPRDQLFAYGVASKIFDYMIAERPILTLADEGPVSRIVRSTKIGDVLNPLDVKAMKEFLSKAFDKYIVGELKVAHDAEEIEKYDIRVLAAMLSRAFDRLA